ncbi:hypothetical protein FRX31_023743 [Thalictrum thalictroides]|uniref:Uncharacterized protein n=1 Tax=Thalictrum thalictroides TaxID=46969 RepID=A0A7J6VPH9_THATH|nr:hypothetical protein FRX31_023743 [Thalictrum thalictroides]
MNEGREIDLRAGIESAPVSLSLTQTTPHGSHLIYNAIMSKMPYHCPQQAVGTGLGKEKRVPLKTIAPKGQVIGKEKKKKEAPRPNKESNVLSAPGTEASGVHKANEECADEYTVRLANKEYIRRSVTKATPSS